MSKNYITKHGPEVRVHNGRTSMSLDWFQEPSACFDCVVDDVDGGYLYWECEECGGGSAKLEKFHREVNEDD